MSLRRVVTVQGLLDQVTRRVETDDQLGRFGLARIPTQARGDLFCRLSAYELARKRLAKLLHSIHRAERELPGVSVALDLLRGFVLGTGGLAYEPHHQAPEQQLAAIRALGITEWVLASPEAQHFAARVLLEQERERQRAHAVDQHRRRRELKREERLMRGISRESRRVS